MIYELNKSEYWRIKDLLKNTNNDDNVVLNAVIEGTNRGKIFVDDVENPKTALVWAIYCMYYFIGDSKNIDFNDYLNAFIENKLGPENLSMGASTFICTLLNEEGWKDTIEEVFCERDLDKGYRQEFNFNKSKYERFSESINKLSEDYYVKRIDKRLLDSDRNETVSVDISDFWNSNEEFLESGIGFCVINEDEVISSCTSCYVSKDKFEILINTYDEEFRNKGCATAAAKSFVDYCIANSITPCWGTDSTNYSSIALAEKLGFEKAERNICYEFLF